MNKLCDREDYVEDQKLSEQENSQQETLESERENIETKKNHGLKKDEDSRVDGDALMDKATIGQRH